MVRAFAYNEQTLPVAALGFPGPLIAAGAATAFSPVFAVPEGPELGVP